MTQGEFAAYIDTNLRRNGINVSYLEEHAFQFTVMVSISPKIWTLSRNSGWIRKKVVEVMKELGFDLRSRYFYHPQVPFFVDFIPGPPAIGQDPIEEIQEKKMETGTLLIISPQIQSGTG
jgi:hypothetical protein